MGLPFSLLDTAHLCLSEIHGPSWTNLAIPSYTLQKTVFLFFVCYSFLCVSSWAGLPNVIYHCVCVCVMLHGVPITPSVSASGLIDLLPMPILALSTQRDVASDTALQHNSLPPQVLMTPFTHWWMIKCSPMQYGPLWLILEMRCPSVD
jgi:hypothetical protein